MMSKTKLRAELLQKRRNMDKATKREFELDIQSRLLLCDEYRACNTVLTYVSTSDEIDTFGIINAAFANKKRVAVPVTNEDFSLSFYYIDSIKELKVGKFNILEPQKRDAPVTDFSDSICVIPALCCDISGNRIGYGKGCYDRFLKDYQGEKICLCYADNIYPSIDVDYTDIKVDAIVSNLYVKHT